LACRTPQREADAGRPTGSTLATAAGGCGGGVGFLLM